MTFSAENNNIQIISSDGDVTFDTGTPMPHIVATLTGTQAHTFAELGQTVVTVSSISYDTLACQEYTYFPQNSGYPDYINTSYYDWVDGPQYWVKAVSRISANETNTTYTLSSLALGTDPDFLIVQLNASRPVAGEHKDYGTFVALIPFGEVIAANGTTLLEGVFDADGEQWLARSVSCRINGDDIEMVFEHSNAQHDDITQTETTACFSAPSAASADNAVSSVWSFDYTIYVGKFTQ